MNMLPTVEIECVTYRYIDGDRDSVRVASRSVAREVLAPEYDLLSYGTPVAWAVDTIRSMAYGFAPSTHPIPDELDEREWLTGVRDYPSYGFEATRAYVYGVTPAERAAIFRMLTRPVEVQHAWHDQVLAALSYDGAVAATYAAV